MATTKKPSDEEQARRFIETARALGCDEDEATFRDKLRVIARQKPKPTPEKPTPEPPRSPLARKAKGTQAS